MYTHMNSFNRNIHIQVYCYSCTANWSRAFINEASTDTDRGIPTLPSPESIGFMLK